MDLARNIRVGVDGFNLAMAQGTGVATYGRGVCRAIRKLGFGLDGIFGVDVGGTHRIDFGRCCFSMRLVPHPMKRRPS